MGWCHLRTCPCNDILDSSQCPCYHTAMCSSHFPSFGYSFLFCHLVGAFQMRCSPGLQSVFFLEFNLYNGGCHVFSLVLVSSLYSLLGSGLVDHVISCVFCLRTSPQSLAKSIAIINSYLFLSNCHLYKSDSKHHFIKKSIIIIINDYLMSANYNKTYSSYWNCILLTITC